MSVPKLGKKCMAVGVVFILGALILEGSVRLLGLILPRLAQLSVPEFYSEERLHPYYGMQHATRIGFPDGLDLKDTGGQSISPEPREGDYRILLLGGSACWGYGVFDPNLRVPVRLRHHLEHFLEVQPVPGIDKFVVINGSAMSYQTRQNSAVMWTLLKYHPNLVVTFDGFNDLGRAVESRAYQLPSDYPGWPWILLTQDNSPSMRIGLWLAKTTPSWWLSRHSQFCRVGLNLITSAFLQAGSSQDEDIIATHAACFPLEAKEEWILEGVANYEANLRKMNALARGMGIDFFTILQPIMGFPLPASEEHKQFLAAREMWDLKIVPSSLWNKGYRGLCAAGHRLQAEGVDWIDGTELYGTRAAVVMVDLMHANEEGQDLVAKFLAKEIMAKAEKFSKKGK